MGAAPPGGVERDAGLLADRAPAETAGLSGGSDHATAQRVLPVTPGRAGERDPDRPVASDDPAQRSADQRRGQGAAGRACCPHRPARRRRQSARVEWCAGRRRQRTRAGACVRRYAGRSRRGSHPRRRLQPRVPGARRLRERRAGARSHPGRQRGQRRRPSAGPSSDASQMDVCSRTMHRSSASSDRLRRDVRSDQLPSFTTISSSVSKAARSYAPRRLSCQGTRTPVPATTIRPWKPTASQRSPAGSGSSPSTSTASARRRSGSGSAQARATSRPRRPASPTSSSTCCSRAPSATTR